ncbi:unnamed protein product [Heterobilharzia americana]|nr:unnamed protein product [Heterobilharzia americana]
MNISRKQYIIGIAGHIMINIIFEIQPQINRILIAKGEAAINWDSIISSIKLWSEEKTYNEKVRILLIEGILIMNVKEIRNMLDCRIFFKTTYENMLQRRKLRKYKTEDPPNYFDEYVWPTYIKTVNQLVHVQDSIKYFDSNDGIDNLYEEVFGYVNELIPFK